MMLNRLTKHCVKIIIINTFISVIFAGGTPYYNVPQSEMGYYNQYDAGTKACLILIIIFICLFILFYFLFYGMHVVFIERHNCICKWFFLDQYCLFLFSGRLLLDMKPNIVYSELDKQKFSMILSLVPTWTRRKPVY